MGLAVFFREILAVIIDPGLFAPHFPENLWLFFHPMLWLGYSIQFEGMTEPEKTKRFP